MTSIDMRFTFDRPVSGDALGTWTAGIDSPLSAQPTVRVHGIDLAHVSRPRAVRALMHQRMTLLQLALLRDREVHRALVVARLEDACDLSRAAAGFAADAASVHRRFELQRGCSFGIAVLVVPQSAPAKEVQLRIVEGAPAVPDGAAAVTWNEAREWGVRTAVNLQTL